MIDTIIISQNPKTVPKFAAGAGEVSSLYGIQYMQDMTSTICSEAKENDTVQLIDKRKNADGSNSKYWVTKLRDGHCWMTQNLDLDITSAGLTAELSDMTTDWNSATNSSYPPVVTQTGANPNFSSTTNAVQSWDPGIRLCNASNSCTSPTTSDYDLHYTSGNYYSWGAATAGQAGSLVSTAAGETATQSICPKNWALPVNGAYGDLFNSYGKASGLLYGTQSILNEPLYFIRGGYVNGSSLDSAGSGGRYWSSTAYGDTSAYYLNFTTSVNPSSSNVRYLGYSVRCVAR